MTPTFLPLRSPGSLMSGPTMMRSEPLPRLVRPSSFTGMSSASAIGPNSMVLVTMSSWPLASRPMLCTGSSMIEISRSMFSGSMPFALAMWRKP